MLYPIVLIGLCAFLLSVVLTPVCRDLFRRLGIVDRPDHDRKLHTEPVPHMGGVPIALAYLSSCALLHGPTRAVCLGIYRFLGLGTGLASKSRRLRMTGATC